MSKPKTAVVTYIFVLAFLELLYSLVTYMIDKSLDNWFVFQPIPLIMAVLITGLLVNKTD
jgi:hypothetical protein